MKNILNIIFAIIFMIFTTLCFCQELNNTSETTEKEKKISYSFFNEFGLGVGGRFDGGISVEITGVLVNGISFNKKQDMIGLGVGCDLFYVVFVRSYPFFVNYRHYFPSKSNFKPLINVALGPRLTFLSPNWFSPDGVVKNPKIECMAGLYSTVAGGFRYKALSFTSGVFVKSWDIEGFMSGVEIKVGYAF
jgi:hypothetical protein